MRLVAVYALLDAQTAIDLPHLKAALALWQYCEDSVRYIFGDSLGDPLADEMLALLRRSAQGMTQTEISNAFGRNKSADAIARALGVLQEIGLADHEPRDTVGGKATVWKAISTK
jgi:hypothetical protein